MKQIAEILEEVLEIKNCESCDDFIEAGLLDSLDVMELVEALEDEYEIEISGRDIVPENFINVQAISELLKKYDVEI